MVRGGSCHPCWGPQHWAGLRHSVMGRNAVHGEVQLPSPPGPAPAGTKPGAAAPRSPRSGGVTSSD